MVSFVPLFGLEIGVTSLVGRYMGAKEPDIAHRSAMSGLKIGWGYSAVILILFVFFAVYLVDVFNPGMNDPVFKEAFPVAVFMIRIASIYILIEAVFVVFVGALRGAGDTFWTMCYTVALHWVLVVVLVLMLNVWKFSPGSGWLTIVIIFFLFSWGIFFRYRAGKWKSIEVVESPGIPVQDGFHEPRDL
jgi:MATE family multidrug resistance protein